MDDGDNDVLMLPLLCLLLCSVIARSTDDHMVITNIHVDRWLDDWGWGYSRIQRRGEG